MWLTLLGDVRKKPLEFVAGLESPMKRDTQCPTHRHSSLEIVYHAKGDGTTTIDSHTFLFSEGSIVINAPEAVHDQYAQTELHDLCVFIKLPARLQKGLLPFLYIPQIEETWIVEEMQKLGRDGLSPSPVERDILSLRATALLLALLDHSSRAQETRKLSPGEHYVRRAEAFMAKHFAKIDSLSDVAEHAGVSSDHLRHLFQTLRGKTVIRHLNEVRIDRAKALLLYSPISLKQIATMCGFRDEYYFSTVFRKIVGVSPGGYRKMA